ncbi:MAG: hypothetical protein QOH91_1932 [Mycobacterium sp.]|nr:hypothetical protein [Mycobacterium sp.]
MKAARRDALTLPSPTPSDYARRRPAWLPSGTGQRRRLARRADAGQRARYRRYTRANAVSDAEITVNPAPATTDLREIRAAVKQALIRRPEVRAEERAMLSTVPLLGLVPRRLLLRAGDRGASTNVASSNLGVVNPAAGRPDGTDADYFAVKNVYRGMTEAMIHQMVGLQFCLFRVDLRGQVFVFVTPYQSTRPNSNDRLRQALSSTLNDFSVTSTTLVREPWSHRPFKKSPRRFHYTASSKALCSRLHRSLCNLKALARIGRLSGPICGTRHSSGSRQSVKPLL